MECYNCQVTQTPLWRRTADRAHPLCNACGLYFKQYGVHRPMATRHTRRNHTQSAAATSVSQAAKRAAHPYASSGAAARPRPSSVKRSASDTVTIAPAQPDGATTPPLSPTTVSSVSSALSMTVPVTSNDVGDVKDMSCATTTTAPLSPLCTTQSTPTALTPAPPASSTTTKSTPRAGVCHNCGQTQTPLWRKSMTGQVICNACGLYEKLHKSPRPASLHKGRVQRRRRDWPTPEDGSEDSMDNMTADVSTATSPVKSEPLTSSATSPLLEQSSQHPTPTPPPSTGSPEPMSKPSSPAQKPQALTPPSAMVDSLVPLPSDEQDFRNAISSWSELERREWLQLLEQRVSMLRGLVNL
jgi:uncharacterized Zn finger protein (UPF0148 family)